MRRLLIFPVPEYGHIAPTLAIAAHYVSLGCEVVYLTLATFRVKVGTVGASLIPILPENAQGTGQRVWTLLAPSGAPGERGRVLTKRLSDTVAESQFDLVILDALLASSLGCDVASALGTIPRVYVSPTLLPWKMRPLPNVDSTLIVLCPGELEVARFRNLPAGSHYAEPSQDPSPFDAALSSLPSDDRPLVVAAWGTQSVRYTELGGLLERVAELARSHPDYFFAVASGGNHAGREKLAAKPAPNLFICDAFEQRLLLSKAKVMLNHGGLSSIKECILCRVPMLIFPFLTDQPLNAMRVAKAELGVALFQEDQSISNIGAALDRAISGAFQPQLERMQRMFLECEERRPSHQLIDSHIR
jgi:UDP:flavonoid glycosyltransferase YjiC (YdhE family)